MREVAKLADFLAILRMIREGVLERFIIPGLGISYWRFIIYMGFAAIVIVALVNKLPIGLLGHSLSEDASRKHREASRKEFLWRQDEMDRRHSLRQDDIDRRFAARGAAMNSRSRSSTSSRESSFDLDEYKQMVSNYVPVYRD